MTRWTERCRGEPYKQSSAKGKAFAHHPEPGSLPTNGARSTILTTLRLQKWEIMVGLKIPSDVKVSAPAMNVAQSLKFYKALGWKVNWRADDDNSAELELAGN